MSTHSKNLFRVKQSGIHGTGLFAATHINEGDVLGSIKYQPVTEDGPYVLWIDQNTGIQVDCELKYINHSTSPNACYCEDLDVIALTDIMLGAEITHDYGDDWD